MYRLIVLCFVALAAMAPGTAPAEELQPGIRIVIPFGGARATPKEPSASLRLDYGAGEGGIAHAPMAGQPALVAWTFTPHRHELALNGVALAATDYRVMGAEDGSSKAAAVTAITSGGVLTVVGIGAAVVYFWRGVADGMVDTGVAVVSGGGGTQTEDPCAGVAVNEECIGG